MADFTNEATVWMSQPRTATTTAPTGVLASAAVRATWICWTTASMRPSGPAHRSVTSMAGAATTGPARASGSRRAAAEALADGAAIVPPSVATSDTMRNSTAAGKRTVAGSWRSWPAMRARAKAAPGVSTPPT